ncbi:MAG: N-formylglutamate amidohydrolase [Gemmobacter sp.]
MSDPAFTLRRPSVVTTPVVFSSPHSGRDYAPVFIAQSMLDPHTLRSSEDAFVDELFAAAPACGAPLLAARVPRAWIDLNRACDELDPALIEGVQRGGHNPRISSGLGVIPRVVANGRAIYAGRIARIEADRRIERAWRPYHATLRSLTDEALTRFGQAVLIDCHSMPHEAIEAHARPGQPRPEVVLGDRFGAAARRDVIDRIEAAFLSAGFRVARNAPFAGAYITQAYGRPSRNAHAVQIEIDRALYMDEVHITRRPDFGVFRDLIGSVVAEITGARPARVPLAAE